MKFIFSITEEYCQLISINFLNLAQVVRDDWTYIKSINNIGYNSTYNTSYYVFKKKT